MEPLLATANLFRAGPMVVPGNNYERLIACQKLDLTPDAIARRELWKRWHRLAIRNIIQHLRAVRCLDSDYSRPSSPADRRAFDAEFLPYLTMYGDRPFIAYFKMLEGRLFRSLPESMFGDDTVEIGVSDGRVSALHFAGRHVELGCEFVAQRLTGGLHPHRRLFAADLRSLPLAEHSLNSVFMVHIIDDLSFGIDAAIAEAGRVIRPGGSLVFSSVSDLYGRHQTVEGMKRVIPGVTPEGLSTYVRERHTGLNIHSHDDLGRSLAAAGFTIERYEEFLSIGAASAWDVGMTAEMGLARTMASLLVGYPRLAQGWRDYLCRVFCNLMLAEQKDGQRGINCFVVARKSGGTYTARRPK
ncbi:MAG: class I SAM-dependent methyltransferase [Alphaproteobacteria bacterium]|nr:class I SAM-dependent methyltransferase [Alphaproteobacteria bacterium]